MMRFFLSACCFLLRILLFSAQEHGDGNHSVIKIGVVLDLNSPTGATINSSMSMALSDFYSSHLDYRTRLVLHTVDVHTELDAVSAVLELLNTEGVQGIVGSEVSTEAFVAELGSKAHIPIISFTPSSLSHAYTASPNIFQMTADDKYQAQAIASICKTFEWRQVVILYEDNKYGNQFNSQLIKALQEVDVHMEYMISLPPSAQVDEISTQLKTLKSIQTRVFLVHMSTSLRSHIFHLAKKLGMMSEGYAWVFTTDSLSNNLSSMDSTVTSSWQGAVGVRPYVPKSENLENFKARWKSNMIQMSHRETMAELNVYSLWAYDTTRALVMAIERIYETMDGNFIKVCNGKNNSDAIDAVRLDTAYKSQHIMRSLRNEDTLNLTFGFTNVKVSKFGAKLLNEMLDMKFTGLSGEFKLVDYQLRPSAFEIFNVIGKGERTVGYWSPSKGITRGLDPNSGEKLKTVIWPGDSLSKPKVWGVPHTGKLKIGVPIKQGFTEFVKVEIDPSTNETKVAGFSIDVFQSVLETLPVKLDYEFLPFVNESGQSLGIYYDLLHKVAEKNFDAVVGDTTILADRASYVDFTLPYIESGASMVVKVNRQKDMWVFIKPLTWDLWVTAAASSITLGFVVWIVENGTLKEKAEALFMSTRTLSNYSRFAMVIWLFIVIILTSSYTASLSAMLTVNKLDHFKISDDHYVGYQQGSFLSEFLVTKLHLNDSKLRGYSTVDQYHNAMTKGGKQGGIDAIFDEIPYIKLFLRRYGSEYKMVGPTYRTDGFGFAFPRGSPLVPHFSRAILKLIQSENMSRIENKYFGELSSSVDSFSESKATSLGSYSFGPFFILNFIVIILALLSRIFTVYSKTTSESTSKDSKIRDFDSPAKDWMPRRLRSSKSSAS